jgi:D-alanine-D-alanine ligase
MPNNKERVPRVPRVPVVILYNTYKTWTPQEMTDADKFTQAMVDGLKGVGHKVAVCEFWKDVQPAIHRYKPSDWIVFNWCEGIEDETGGDARICADLDTLGYTYTGNPPHTLRLSVQKGRVKKVLQRWNIPTPPGREFGSADEVTADAWDKSWFPAIIKPVSQHCSVAVTRDAVVHDMKQLRERVGYVVETVKEAVIAESFVVGREINVGVWGNGRPRVLPLREIDFSVIENPLHRMVTWDSKWVPDSPEWNSMPVITQPVVSDALRARVEDIALRTYRAFDCRDYARVDLRIDSNEQPYVVDVNPNPDITPDGGFAGACNAAGYTYAGAISNIISMAVARRNRREALANTMQRLRGVRTPARVPVPA